MNETYGEEILIGGDAPPPNVDLNKTGRLEWRSDKDWDPKRWNSCPMRVAHKSWTEASWRHVTAIRLPKDHPYYTEGNKMTKIDYSKPLTFSDAEYRGQPKNLRAEQFGRGPLHVVSWDSNRAYAAGRCLFDENGKWVGDLDKPDGLAGSGLKIVNAPVEKVAYMRISALFADEHGHPEVSVHDYEPSGSGIAVIKLTTKDGILLSAELQRSNKLEFKEGLLP